MAGLAQLGQVRRCMKTVENGEGWDLAKLGLKDWNSVKNGLTQPSKLALKGAVSPGLVQDCMKPVRGAPCEEPRPAGHNGQNGGNQ